MKFLLVTCPIHGWNENKDGCSAQHSSPLKMPPNLKENKKEKKEQIKAVVGLYGLWRMLELVLTDRGGKDRRRFPLCMLPVRQHLCSEPPAGAPRLTLLLQRCGSLLGLVQGLSRLRVHQEINGKSGCVAEKYLLTCFLYFVLQTSSAVPLSSSALQRCQSFGCAFSSSHGTKLLSQSHFCAFCRLPASHAMSTRLTQMASALRSLMAVLP